MRWERTEAGLTSLVWRTMAAKSNCQSGTYRGFLSKSDSSSISCEVNNSSTFGGSHAQRSEILVPDTFPRTRRARTNCGAVYLLRAGLPVVRADPAHV